MSKKSTGMKKIGLLTATLLAVGNMIGSGILGTLPSAVSMAGNMTFVCIIVAAVNVFFSYFALMIVCGVLPANAGPYLYLTRLVHPAMAIFEILSRLCQFFLIALMGTIFSGYFTTLFPKADPMLVSVLVIAAFGLLNLFGINAAAKVGNVLVVMLFASFMLFSYYGLTVDTSTIASYVPAEAKPLTGVMVGTVSALFVTTLTGGLIVGEIADTLERPEKNIVKAFTYSIVIVAVIYTIMSFATARAAGQTSFDSLAAIAEQVMPRGAFYFFIICGAMFAVLTTINALIIQTSFYFDVFAEDKLLPEMFNRKNKQGVRFWNVLLTTACPILILLFKLDIFTLLAVTSVLLLFVTLIKLVIPLLIEKKYPNAYRKAYLHPPFRVMVVFVIIAAALNIYSGVATVLSTPGTIWMVMLALIGVFAVYYFARRAYLKRKGIDLDQILSTPPQSWLDLENN